MALKYRSNTPAAWSAMARSRAAMSISNRNAQQAALQPFRFFPILRKAKCGDHARRDLLRLMAQYAVQQRQHEKIERIEIRNAQLAFRYTGQISAGRKRFEGFQRVDDRCGSNGPNRVDRVPNRGQRR